MSTSLESIKAKLIKDLVTDLTDEDMVKLLATIQQKIEKGHGPESIALQLVNATAQVIQFGFPGLDEADVLELAEDVADAIIDRVIEHTGGIVTDMVKEVVPHGQLN